MIAVEIEIQIGSRDHDHAPFNGTCYPYAGTWRSLPVYRT